MRKINDLLKDDVYNRLLAKFEENGPFSFGKEYDTTIYWYEGNDIPMDYMAFGRYIYAIRYQKKKLYEVPRSFRTEEFYINTFYYTYDYIKDNIYEFNRNFFKDLIMNNEGCLEFKKNCFSIMPLKYIDEEMVSLAILCGNDWADQEWLLTVLERKPEVITEDVWKPAARLYGRRTFEKIISITPNEYKDEEWYLELFKCTYHLGVRLDGRDTYHGCDDRTVLMDYVDQEVLTKEFLTKLLLDDIRNIARFNEYALETKIVTGLDVMGNPIEKKIWQVALEADGKTIEYIDLNEERIKYFKSLYDRDSIEYITFKYKYRDYKRSKKPIVENDDLTLVALDALLYAREGDDPTKAIDNEIKRNRDNMKKSVDKLPVFYYGDVPEEYSKEYDSEEYLDMIYEKLGIKIIDDSDYLLYKVSLPDNCSIEYKDYYGVLKDNDGNELIHFFRDDKFYDRQAYVSYINPMIEEETYQLIKK